ncbi:hypothetical protein AC578_3584 [Pseudocercospora eumusae]|uniref:Uncharacterized protein n=1 Tax=Pseudocercospora eumusae TaxID=321146 RepID=A0A139HPF7_9PEZI|nr:hypothetical protein AC578_3584 [Pseudocercospora eumusae]
MNGSKLESNTFLTPTTCFSIACLAFSLVALSTLWQNSSTQTHAKAGSRLQRRKAVDSVYFGARDGQPDQKAIDTTLERTTGLVSLCTRISQCLSIGQNTLEDRNRRYELALLTTTLCRLQQGLAFGCDGLQTGYSRRTGLDTTLETLRHVLLSWEHLLDSGSTLSPDLDNFLEQIRSQRLMLDFFVNSSGTSGLPPTPPLNAHTNMDKLQVPVVEEPTATTPGVDEKCWIDPPPEYSPPTDDVLPLIAEKADSRPRPASLDSEASSFDADALHNAIISNDTATLTQLLSQGADPTTTFGELQRTPLHLAAHLNHHTCISTLLDHGAVMITEDAKGDTPLHLAAWAGNVETLNILVSHGADVDWLSGRDGYSPLWCAISAHQIDAARLLLKHGARVSLKANGLMPLHQAAVTSQSAMCELLIDRGAKIDCLDDDRNTPLHYASACGSIASVKALLRAGADIEAEQTYGLRPVHWAAHKNHVEVVEFLLDHGAKLDVKAEEGATPLHLAASRGHFAVVKLLLERGCSRRPGSARWDGVVGSPAEMAKGKGFGRVVRLLRN